MAGVIGRAIQGYDTQRDRMAQVRENLERMQMLRDEHEARQRQRELQEGEAFMQRASSMIEDPKWEGWTNPQVRGDMLAGINHYHSLRGLPALQDVPDNRLQQMLADLVDLRAKGEQHRWITPGFAQYILQGKYGAEFVAKSDNQIRDQAALAGINADQTMQPKQGYSPKAGMSGMAEGKESAPDADADTGAQPTEPEVPQSVIDMLFSTQTQRFSKPEDVEVEWNNLTGNEKSLAQIATTNPGYLNYLVQKGKELGSPLFDYVDVGAMIKRGKMVQASAEAEFLRNFVRDTKEMDASSRAEYWASFPEYMTAGLEMPDPKWKPTETALLNARMRVYDLLNRDKWAAAREARYWLEMLIERGVGPENEDHQFFSQILSEAMSRPAVPEGEGQVPPASLEGFSIEPMTGSDSPITQAPPKWGLGQLPAMTQRESESQATRDRNAATSASRESRIASGGGSTSTTSGKRPLEDGISSTEATKLRALGFYWEVPAATAMKVLTDMISKQYIQLAGGKYIIDSDKKKEVFKAVDAANWATKGGKPPAKPKPAAPLKTKFSAGVQANLLDAAKDHVGSRAEFIKDIKVRHKKYSDVELGKIYDYAKRQ